MKVLLNILILLDPQEGEDETTLAEIKRVTVLAKSIKTALFKIPSI